MGDETVETTTTEVTTEEHVHTPAERVEEKRTVTEEPVKVTETTTTEQTESD